MSDVVWVCLCLFSSLWAYFLLFCLFERGVKELFIFAFFLFFNITAGILCGTELCNNICAYQTTIWVGGKQLNLVHMHEVNEDLTIAGLQITSTTENRRLGRGYRKPKGKDYLSGIILFLLEVSSAFIQSSDSASTCLVRKSLKVRSWPIWNEMTLTESAAEGFQAYIYSSETEDQLHWFS